MTQQVIRPTILPAPAQDYQRIPHGPFFHSSQVWGPTMGTDPYVGFRHVLK